MPQLAKIIRDKYPGAYDDMDDATLEKSVLEKYPEYEDLVTPEKGIIDKAFDKAKEILANPRVREIGERLLTGTSPENEKLVRDAQIESLRTPGPGLDFPASRQAELARLGAGGNVPVIGTPQSEPSLLPTWKSQPETFARGFAKSIYEDFVRPMATPSGIVGSADTMGFNPFNIGVRRPPMNHNLLPPATRFYGSPSGLVDIETTPLRKSTEVPYRGPESFDTSEKDLMGAFRTSARNKARQELVRRPFTAADTEFEGVQFSRAYKDDNLFKGSKGEGLGKEPFDEQWKQSIKEADKLGIDYKSYDNLDELQWDITRKTAQITRETGKNPLDEISDFPQFARSEQGGIKVGQNIRRSTQELTTGYSNPLEGIMVREGMQNAIDATRHLGDDGRIKVRVGEDDIEISDNGKGMTRQQLETVFSDLHESGKTTEAGATGGKGVGKATYMLGGKHFKAETVVFENGKKIKYTIEGTPEDFATHVPVNDEVVPLSTPTGTTIKTQFKEGQERYYSSKMLDTIMKDTRGVKAKVIVNKYLQDEPETAFSIGNKDKLIGKTKVLDNDVSIAIPEKSELKPRSHIDIAYLNNGMYQFSDSHYLGEEVPNMPERLLVDIHPYAEEGSPKYPFPVQRESIKKDLDKEIKTLINDRLANPEKEGRKIKLKELYESMPIVASNTKRKSVLYDPGNRLAKEELLEFQTSPAVDQMLHLYDDVIDSILVKVGNEKWIDRLEGVGIVLDPGMHGVHIPNPTTGKSTILINPFEHIVSGKAPDETALESVITALHEVGHIGMEKTGKVGSIPIEELKDPRVGRFLESYLTQVLNHGGIDMGHGMSFVHRLGEVYAKFGPRKSLGAADKFRAILTDESGGYNSEVQKLLQIYKESRGRDPVTEDFLSGTGVKSKVGKVGKGNVPSGGDSDGGGITRRAVSKLLENLKGARGLREEQENIYRVGRAKRFTAFESVREGGMAGAKKQLSKLKGEFEHVDADQLNIGKEETDALFTAIKKANITSGEKASGYTALFKLLDGGQVPQRSQLAILDSVFGNGFSNQVMELHGGLGGVPIKMAKVANTMKVMSSMLDVSAALRQGIGLIHRPEWRTAFVEMFKYLGKEEYFKAAMKELEQRPTYLLGRQSGLFLAKPDNLLEGEEAFLNSYIHSLPVIKDTVGKLANISERAYIGFLNKLRADTFDNMIKQASGLGHQAFSVVKDGESTTIVPTQSAIAISRYINNATGRGSLGRLEKMAPELNMVLWSPRLLSSRISMLTNPKIYTDLPKGMRLEGLKALFGVAALSTTVSSLGAVLAEGKTSLNILDSDAGKVRFGTKVLDPFGGFQQPIVAAARFISGRNEIAPQNRFLTADRFRQSKMSPMANFAEDLMRARTFTGGGNYTNQFGDRTSVQREFGKRFVPMIIQDIYDLAESDPGFGEAVGLNSVLTAAAAIGMGTQNYADRTMNKKRPIRRMSLRP